MLTRYASSTDSFEWDSEKEAANRKKHGISFADAIAVFEDERAILVFDDAHSEAEDRFRIIGRLRGQLIALVVVTDRGAHTRIISARLANKHEVQLYEGRSFPH